MQIVIICILVPINIILYKIIQILCVIGENHFTK